MKRPCKTALIVGAVFGIVSAALLLMWLRGAKVQDQRCIGPTPSCPAVTLPAAPVVKPVTRPAPSVKALSSATGMPATVSSTSTGTVSAVKQTIASSQAAPLPVPNVPRARQIRLANRVIALREHTRKFPSRFAEMQKPSPRGTVAYAVISEAPVSKAIRDRAAAHGARVICFLPNNALLVEANAAALGELSEDVLFAGAYEFTSTDKIQQRLSERLDNGSERLPVTVVPLSKADIPGIIDSVVKGGGMVIKDATEGRDVLRAEVPATLVKTLSGLGEVRWIETYSRPGLLNNVAVQDKIMNVRTVWDRHGLTGAGQIISTSDSGLDTGDPATVMADFKGRICKINAYVQGKDTDGHGTHTAGSMIGDGSLSSGEIKGVAYGAKLYVWGCMDASGNLYMPSFKTMFETDRTMFPVSIHSASWGEDKDYSYSASSGELDTYVWQHPEFLPVFSAGNKGRSGAGTINSPATAKNCLTVGATQNYRPYYTYGNQAKNASIVADYSSRGPCSDGRVKPDVVAPGTAVLSTRTTQTTRTDFGWGAYTDNRNYVYDSGTSMATPLTAGAAALVRQWLIERRGYTNEPPTAALMKAVLVGGARELAKDIGTNVSSAAPNTDEGWGRVEVGEALYPSNRTVRLVDRIPFSSEKPYTVRVTVTNTAPLDVQLVWVDAPGDPTAAKALVNDLNLVVSNETTGAVWLGNDKNGTGIADDLNNVESVRISAAEPAVYTLFVTGASVPYDWSEGGAAALYIRGAFTDEPDTHETVRLWVFAGSESPGEMSPARGSWTFSKDVPVRLTASAFVVTNAYGTSVLRRQLLGWIGEGDVPAHGTNESVFVRLTQDSAILWEWSEVTELPLRRYIWLASANSYYDFYNENWFPTDTVLTVPLPEASPVGSDRFDLTDRFYSYYNNGAVKRMTEQRLCAVERTRTDEIGDLVSDEAGRLPETFQITLNEPTDLLFYYHDVDFIDSISGLPGWWYMKYLYLGTGGGALGFASADADGDGVSNADEYAADTDPVDRESSLRILSFSPDAIVWRGGHERIQVLERTEKLGAEAVWTGVQTNLPPTETYMTNFLRTVSSTNSFYRIRAF